MYGINVCSQTQPVVYKNTCTTQLSFGKKQPQNDEVIISEKEKKGMSKGAKFAIGTIILGILAAILLKGRGLKDVAKKAVTGGDDAVRNSGNASHGIRRKVEVTEVSLSELPTELQAELQKQKPVHGGSSVVETVVENSNVSQVEASTPQMIVPEVLSKPNRAETANIAQEAPKPKPEVGKKKTTSPKQEGQSEQVKNSMKEEAIPTQSAPDDYAKFADDLAEAPSANKGLYDQDKYDPLDPMNAMDPSSPYYRPINNSFNNQPWGADDLFGTGGFDF